MKRVIALALCFLLAFALCPPAFAAGTMTSEFAGGSGTEGDPYLIETVDQLNSVRNYLGTEHSNKHFKLDADLKLDVAPYNSGTGWEPIGTQDNPFTGRFDGNGHTISNLFINRSSDENRTQVCSVIRE